jgi:hypothetical protein
VVPAVVLGGGLFLLFALLSEVLPRKISRYILH